MMGAGERGAILLGESTTRVGSDEAIVGIGDVQSSDVRPAKRRKVVEGRCTQTREREEVETEMSLLTMWWSDQTQDAGAVVSAGTGTKYRHY